MTGPVLSSTLKCRKAPVVQFPFVSAITSRQPSIAEQDSRGKGRSKPWALGRPLAGPAPRPQGKVQLVKIRSSHNARQFDLRWGREMSGEGRGSGQNSAPVRVLRAVTVEGELMSRECHCCLVCAPCLQFPTEPRTPRGSKWRSTSSQAQVESAPRRDGTLRDLRDLVAISCRIFIVKLQKGARITLNLCSRVEAPPAMCDSRLSTRADR